MFVPRVHSIELRDAVGELLDTGLSDYEISRRTGVGRTTVQRWRLRGIPADQPEISIEIEPESWDDADRNAYAYLLGLYLGDGYVGTIGRTHSLVIACDIRYSIAALCEMAPGKWGSLSGVVGTPSSPPAIMAVRTDRVR